MKTNEIKKGELMAQAKFLHVEGIGLVMLIEDFNSLMEKFEVKPSIKNAFEQRREKSV